MTEAATEDPIKAAATLEADTLQRAGQITLTQAKARVRDRLASPVAHLALQQTEALQRALAALRELHSVVALMNHPDESKWPTDAEVDAAMQQAQREPDAQDAGRPVHARALRSPTAPGAEGVSMTDLSIKIMNIPVVADPRDGGAYLNGYRQGHRDARHAAAELALAATQAPARAALTDAEIDALWIATPEHDDGHDFVTFARMVERAHGITAGDTGSAG